MMDPLVVANKDPPCPMCNDKQGMGAPPKPKTQVIIYEVDRVYMMILFRTQCVRDVLAARVALRR